MLENLWFKKRFSLTRNAAISSVVSLAIVSASSLAASADAQGQVVLARTGAHALVIWNATSVVGKLPTDAAGLHKLDDSLAAAALNIIAAKASSLSHSTDVTVRILYAHQVTGDAAYGAQTFGALTPIVAVTAPMATFTANAAHWQQQLQAGTTPNALTLKTY